MKIRFEDFTIKQCTTNHLDEIVRLQDEVLAGLPSPEFLRANTVEMLEECLRPPHYTFGAWYGKFWQVFRSFITRILTRKISRCLL